jgi:hypothetical protein
MRKDLPVLAISILELVTITLELVGTSAKIPLSIPENGRYNGKLGKAAGSAAGDLRRIRS